MSNESEHTMDEMEPGLGVRPGVVSEALAGERDDLKPYIGWLAHVPRRSVRHGASVPVACILMAPDGAAPVRGASRVRVELT